VIFVGASHENGEKGSVYIFRPNVIISAPNSRGDYEQLQKLDPPSPGFIAIGNSRLGIGVSIDETT
jgi:hypothetical protein